MKKIYQLPSQTLIGDKWTTGIGRFYSSKKAAEFFLEQEMSVNKAKNIKIDTSYMEFEGVEMSKVYSTISVDGTYMTIRVSILRHYLYSHV